MRYCPALARKPKGNDSYDKGKPKPDPFDNPPEELLIAAVPRKTTTHNLVLNKYPVIPNHFILATKANKPQTDLLEEDDLAIAYECLNLWRDATTPNGHQLFSFFNSGEHSGASQVHRHLQFLPVEEMKQQSDGGWCPLLERMTEKAHGDLPLLHDPALPLLHFATRLEPDISAHSLHAKYVMLMKAALSARDQPSAELQYDDNAMIARDGQTTFSYNLAMTSDLMAICPRKDESATIPGNGTESSVAINGTILGGTLMVKSEREQDVLRERPELLDRMLTEIGFALDGSSDAASTKL